ncbi:MAG: SAM-dependent methyltransferase [Pseudomonadota bacterium]|nr:SAM-dependent methyltransferase [Pseudomonadota bacterium]
MTPMTSHLRNEIAMHGPLTVAAYMAAAMGHPEHGYYINRDPLGMTGDFVTSPEVSQMFGELIGLWCVAGWHQMGSPDTVRLVEMGPGRGTLMADALRAMTTAPECRAALDVHLVETSPTLSALQRKALDGISVAWHDALAEVPEGPLLLVTNELYDVLPIHQFIRTLQGWRERLVDTQSQGGFRFVLADQPTPALALLPDSLDGAPINSFAEMSAAAISLTHDIARRLVDHGGLALIIDYASDQGPLGDTFQAVRDHGNHHVLDDPGEADLSARVDFTTVARVARDGGAEVYGPVSQGEFLLALGIEARAAKLATGASAGQRQDIETALGRLIGSGEMGSLFKVLAIAAPGAPAPAGFEAAP